MICSCCNPGISIVICCLGSGGIFGDTGIRRSQKVGYALRENVLSSCCLKQMKPYPSPLKGGVHGAMIVSKHTQFGEFTLTRQRGFPASENFRWLPRYFSPVWHIKIWNLNEFNEIYPDHKIAHYSYCRNISRKPHRFTDGRSFCLNKQYRISSKNEIPSTKIHYPEDRCTTVPCLPSDVMIITIFVVRLPISFQPKG